MQSARILVIIIDFPHLFAFNAKTLFPNRVPNQVNSKLLVYLSFNVTSYLWKTWSKCLSISGGICGLLDAGKGIRETTCQLRIDLETVRRWRDSFRTGEVKDRPCAGNPGWHWQDKSGDVYGIFKLQLFLCDPASIKCPEVCYFTLIFRK